MLSSALRTLLSVFVFFIIARVSTLPLQVPEFQETSPQDTSPWRDYGFAIDEPSFSLHRRDADSSSRCHNLTKTEQVEKIPGWGTLLEFAKKRYGKGGRHILVYDENVRLPYVPLGHEGLTLAVQYPGVDSARVCISSHAVQIQLSEPPSCSFTNTSTGGMISGSHGIASVTGQSGYTGSSSSYITQAAAYGDVGSYSARFYYPDVASARVGLYSTSSFTNSQSSRIELSINEQVTATYNMTVQDGQSCQAMETVRSCTFKGTGKIPFTASGNVWFEYDDPTYNHELDNSKHQSKHYKYAFDLTEVLPDASQRTLYATFGGTFSVDSHGQYKAMDRIMNEVQAAGTKLKARHLPTRDFGETRKRFTSDNWNVREAPKIWIL
ncbi:hypothetical protein EV361DRAFT_864882 [Lentinula raphanica]|nr:hypothetical protein EV361DRAFT_864882 [Lentinula raphanica]